MSPVSLAPDPLAELGWLLRPAGGGIHTVSTGKAAQQRLQAQLYGTGATWDREEIDRRFRANLSRVAGARVVVLGIPSDTGAGLVRGAAFGPQELRLGLLRTEPHLLMADGVVDVGDVAVIPHLLHDDMVSEPQKQTARAALYPGLAGAADLPVAPLSLAERALERIFDLNPRVRVLVLGGDHSVAWPVVAVLARRRAPRLGIVQPDAHTDLLPERLGVPICFATWAYHANQAIGGDGRLVQVGIRASGRPREHWESTLGVRQFWASEIAARGDAVIDDIVTHLQARGIRQIYFSNDIDATDMTLAPSTGAPEPDGLQPAFIVRLIERLGRAFDLVGADLVEVAPPVGAPNDSQKTVSVGVGYLAASLQALLGSSSA